MNSRPYKSIAQQYNQLVSEFDQLVFYRGKSGTNLGVNSIIRIILYFRHIVIKKIKMALTLLQHLRRPTGLF